MKANYHTHVYRCGHASATEIEMVEQAIQVKLDELGFSCHIPLPHLRLHLLKSMKYCHNVHSVLSLAKSIVMNGPGMRMTFKEKDEYLKSIEKCQKKYGHELKIYKGFEAEYLESYLEYYKKLLKEDVDYLILGHHFDTYVSYSCSYAIRGISQKKIERYVNQAIKAMESGLFLYFAHPDLFLKGYDHWDDFAIEQTKRLLSAAKKLDVILEINGAGLRNNPLNFNNEKKQGYPNLYFWNLAIKNGNKIILGLDAHSKDELSLKEIEKIENYARNLGAQVIEKIDVEKYRKQLNLD